MAHEPIIQPICMAQDRPGWNFNQLDKCSQLIPQPIP